MLNKTDVIYAYRLILGRDPENETVIETHRQAKDLPELRKVFMASDEFKTKLASSSSSTPIPQSLSINVPPIQVEITGSEPQMQAMVSHIQNAWKAMGTTEPFWSVVTSDHFKMVNFSDNKNSFYDSGRGSLATFLTMMERNQVDHSTFHSCLEYGCGVGRVTLWLAQQFEQVIACDISAPHLEITQRNLEANRLKNVSLKPINTLEDIEKLPKVDAIFSLIVLQHNPPPVIAMIIRKLMRLLKPGGVAYFQVPTYCMEYRFSIQEYLDNKLQQTEMEMHVLPQWAIFQILAEEKVSLLEVREDDATGSRDKFVSNSFLVQKR